jgi:hypothetical protein
MSDDQFRQPPAYALQEARDQLGEDASTDELMEYAWAFVAEQEPDEA